MSQSFFPVAVVNVSPIPPDPEPPSWWNNWITIDVSAYVPAGATGAIIHCVSTTLYDGQWGLRKYGSTDDIKPNNGTSKKHLWVIVGLSADRKFQIWDYNLEFGYRNLWDFYLIGYTNSNATLFTNVIDKTPGVVGSTQTIDCSVEAPNAVALIFKGGDINNSYGSSTSVWHPSADFSWKTGPQGNHAVVGCNASQQVSGIISNADDRIYLVGYITSSINMGLSRIDKTPAVKESWEDMDLSADISELAPFAFFQMTHGGGEQVGLRRDGSTEDIHIKTPTVQGIVNVISQIVEGYVKLGGAIWLAGDATAIVVPTTTTDPATAIGTTSATLNGTLDDGGGEACDCGFEWGQTIAYGNTTPTQSKTTGQTFSQVISGLSPNTTYHFRAFATNSAGTSYGADRTFTTLVAVPTVTTNPATDVVAISATQNGTLDDDGGEACQVRFQYGLTDAYGTDTAWQPGKVTGDTFEETISGLEPNTTYHFRAQANNSAGTASGADRTFTTQEAATVNRSYALAREEL